MKKELLISIISLVIILLSTLYFIDNNKIATFTKSEEGAIYYKINEGISSQEYRVIYGELNEKCLDLSDEECNNLFYNIDGKLNCVYYLDKNTLILPSVCPGVVSPKGSRACGSMSKPVYREEEYKIGLSSYENTDSIEVCCSNKEYTNYDKDVKKSDFKCSKSYNIS